MEIHEIRIVATVDSMKEVPVPGKKFELGEFSGTVDACSVYIKDTKFLTADFNVRGVKVVD